MKSSTGILRQVTAQQIQFYLELFMARLPRWCESKDIFQGMARTYLSFSTKQEYMAWVFCWRVEINRLNAIVHIERNLMRNGQRGNVRSEAQARRHEVSLSLRGLYEIRRMAKLKASAQRALGMKFQSIPAE